MHLSSLTGHVRPVFYCAACNTGFEVDMKRCPVCRRDRRADRKARMRAADRVRKGISKAKRARVYARDGHRCLACGSERNLTLDHIVPISKGGTNDEANLQTLCARCNNQVKRGKTTSYRGVKA